VRETIADFFDCGVCDTYYIQGTPMQLTAYNHCLKHHGHEFEGWLSLIWMNFSASSRTATPAYLCGIYETYSGLAVNWDSFGSSGFLKRPQGLVTQNYRQSMGYTVNSKCIVRPAQVDMPLSSHHFIFHEGISVNADKRPAISLQAFYSQAARSVVEREDILPVAAEVAGMLVHLPPRAKYAVSYAEVTQSSLPSLIKNITLSIRNSQKDWAEVLFALGWGLWKNTPEYLNIGILLFRQLEKYDHALSLARNLVALTPDKEAYFTLLECLTIAGEREEAVSVGNFLEEFAYLDSKSEFGDKVRQYRKANAP
jgi:hypothetical protein